MNLRHVSLYQDQARTLPINRQTQMPHLLQVTKHISSFYVFAEHSETSLKDNIPIKQRDQAKSHPKNAWEHQAMEYKNTKNT